MSRTFQFTVSDELAREIVQCAYGKGKTPSEYIKNAVTTYTEKNTLTTNQKRRILDKYGKESFFLSELTLKGLETGQNASGDLD